MHYEKFADGSVKCIEDEIPFELPEGWAWCRVRDIAVVKGGKRLPKGTSFSEEKTDHAYIRVTDMKNHSVNITDLRYISEDTFSVIKNYTISKDDLYVTIAGTIGVVGEVPAALDGMNLTENAVKITDIAINKSFLCVVLQTEFVQQQFQDKTHQVAMPKLALERILSTLIPICSCEQQEKIVVKIQTCDCFLSSIDAEKDDLQKTVSLTKSKILDLAIRGKLVPQNPNDEPASVLLERIRTEKEALIKAGKLKRDKKESIIFKGEDNSYYEKLGEDVKNIDDEIPFELPEGWEWVYLYNVASVLNGDRGQNYPAKSKLLKEGIPFVSASNIKDGIVVSDELLCLSESQYEALGAGKLISGDIVYCIRGSLGKCGKFTMEKGAIASSLVIVRSILSERCASDYIFSYLHSSFAAGEIKKYDNGSAQPNLAAKDFMRFLVPLPPLEEQNIICEKLKAMFALIENLEKSLN